MKQWPFPSCSEAMEETHRQFTRPGDQITKSTINDETREIAARFNVREALDEALRLRHENI